MLEIEAEPRLALIAPYGCNIGRLPGLSCELNGVGEASRPRAREKSRKATTLTAKGTPLVTRYAARCKGWLQLTPSSVWALRSSDHRHSSRPLVGLVRQIMTRAGRGRTRGTSAFRRRCNCRFCFETFALLNSSPGAATVPPRIATLAFMADLPGYPPWGPRGEQDRPLSPADARPTSVGGGSR